MIKPGERFNISQIIQNLKRNFSHNANLVMGIHNQTNNNPTVGGNNHCRPEIGTDITAGDNDYYRLPNIKQLILYHKQFLQKYGHHQYQIPQFCWQQSFHDRRIRTEKEFYRHLGYIAHNSIKHCLTNDETKYRWSFLNSEFKDIVDYFYY